MKTAEYGFALLLRFIEEVYRKLDKYFFMFINHKDLLSEMFTK